MAQKNKVQSKTDTGRDDLIPIVGAGRSLLGISAHKPEQKRKRRPTNMLFKSSAAVPAMQDSSVSS